MASRPVLAFSLWYILFCKLVSKKVHKRKTASHVQLKLNKLKHTIMILSLTKKSEKRFFCLNAMVPVIQVSVSSFEFFVL